MERKIAFCVKHWSSDATLYSWTWAKQYFLRKTIDETGAETLSHSDKLYVVHVKQNKDSKERAWSAGGPVLPSLQLALARYPHTIVELEIEFPVAIVDKNINRKKPETRAAAEAFLQYLFTPTAQQEFMDCGFRPVDKALRKKSKLPAVRNVWTVDERLAGWAATQKHFFDEKGVLDVIQRHVGEKRLAERKAAKKG